MLRPPVFLVLLLVLLLSFLSLLSLTSAGIPKHAMLLQDVQTLVFNKGDMTTSRRAKPVPQMNCIGGPCQYAPQSALCRNVGFDGQDVTWKCEAELPKGVKFGKVEVSCEGFSSRDDEYVLKGSCALEYSLQGEPDFESEERVEDNFYHRNIKRDAGQKTHPPRHHSTYTPPSSSWSLSDYASSLFGYGSAYQHAKDYAHNQYESASSSLHHQSLGIFGLLYWIASTLFSLAVKVLAALIILWFVYRLMRPSTSVPPRAARHQPGLFRSLLGAIPFASAFSSLFSGDSSSYHSDYTAPPPYPGNPPPTSNPSAYDKTYRPPPSQQQQSGYGLMHGLLGGSLLGYLLGRRRGNQQPATTIHTEPASSSSWFGFGGSAPRTVPSSQTVHHVHHNAPPPVNPEYVRRSNQAYSPSGMGDVKTTETTTAYARTKRR